MPYGSHMGDISTVPLTGLEPGAGAIAGPNPQPVPESKRLAITSVFGDPMDPTTWSGTPFNIARELRAYGTEVTGILPWPTGRQEPWDGWLDRLTFGGRLLRREFLIRAAVTRSRRAQAIAQAARKLGAECVLHTGTLDMPAPVMADGDEPAHYLYCDHTWNLALRHAPRRHRLFSSWRRQFEDLERESYAMSRHIFTFGRYVRDDLIEHYGVDPAHVTAIGSGMGAIRPFSGPKDYAHGPLLFVAKHFFVEKGGPLAIKAFRVARRRRPDLRLVIVGSKGWRKFVHDEPGVRVLEHVPWNVLEELYHSSALLVQPMLNDPWGQVYLEALISRTPVIGLERNGLPEITENGRHGFLVPVADPVVLAETILDAMSDPDRLARMGESGQRHVMASYSWARVARRIHDVMESE